MSFFPKNLHYIGIDAELSTLKIASIRKKGSSYDIVSLNEIEGTTPASLLDNDSFISSTSSAKQCLIRSFETPLVKERDIFASLDFQTESHLPYSTEQAIIQAQIIEKQERSTKLTVAAIKKDHLQLHLDSLHRHAIEPDLVTTSHFALAALSTLLPAAASLNLYINVGPKVVTCSLAENGKLLSGYAFDASLELKREIQKIILSLDASFKTRPFKSIFFFGDVVQTTLNQIAEITDKSVHLPFSPRLSISQEDLMNYALAIGTAIIGGTKNTPNFRQQEFTYPHPFKRLKKPLFIYATAVVLLTLSLFSLTSLALSHQKKEVACRYQALLAQEGKLTQTLKRTEEYTSALASLKKEIDQKPDTFPLYPMVPKAQEVLAWLSASPVSIEMDTFHYSMIKRPTFSQQKEHYQVKVFFEFKAPVTEARAFHEILLAPNSFVDKNQEVQWTMNRNGTYRSSFYLNDKTRYL